uniref:Purine nucleoside phosphorylase n=1 Tax=Mesocestoides corti TaxID=53468 RepID=A0A5K3FJ63_MESCO
MCSYEEAESVCKFLRSKINKTPLVAIICGSGHGALAEVVKDRIVIKYSEIKEFPRSTVAGHAGNLVFGNIGDKYVMVMQGRFHPYEGHSLAKVTLPIRVMKLLGVEYVFITNAAGILNPKYNVGDLVIIKDHICIPAVSGNNPLVGLNDERFGVRFPTLANAYTKSLRQLAWGVGKEMDILNILHEGIYHAGSGPAYETPAELSAARLWGCDCAGMSTAQETIVAKHAGLKVFAISLMTNRVALDNESEEVANHEEVLEVATQRADLVKTFIMNMVKAL